MQKEALDNKEIRKNFQKEDAIENILRTATEISGEDEPAEAKKSNLALDVYTSNRIEDLENYYQNANDYSGEEDFLGFLEKAEVEKENKVTKKETVSNCNR